MALKFTGIRGMGRMTPEERSNMLKIARAVRGTSQVQRAQPITNETEVARLPGTYQVGSRSAGGRSTVTTFGKDADKPTIPYLQARGVGAFFYVATDTNKVYIWNGTAYKSATFT